MLVHILLRNKQKYAHKGVEGPLYERIDCAGGGIPLKNSRHVNEKANMKTSRMDTQQNEECEGVFFGSVYKK